MPVVMGSARTEQQNFRLAKPVKEAFRWWCASNGYDPTASFLAGWLVLLKLSHEERREYFQAALQDDELLQAAEEASGKLQEDGGRPASTRDTAEPGATTKRRGKRTRKRAG